MKDFLKIVCAPIPNHIISLQIIRYVLFCLHECDFLHIHMLIEWYCIFANQRRTLNQSTQSCKMQIMASEESYTCSGPRSFSAVATKTAWTPSLCKGNGSDTWWEESQTTSLHRTQARRKGDPRAPGIVLWKGKPFIAHGECAEAGLEQTTVAYLCCCPTCQMA